MRLFRRTPAPEPPPKAPAALYVVEELKEEALPGPFRDACNKGNRDAQEAILATSGLSHRVTDLEQALQDPALGLARVVALEQEFDRLADTLRGSVSVHFERKRPRA